MNFKNIGKAVSDISRKAVFNTKKHSPELLTGGAILFGIGTVVATWFAARKTDKALEEPKKIIATAKAMNIDETYTKEDQKHDILLGYRNGAVEIVKLYGPAALMGSFSIACVLGSHRILSDRNAGLVAVNSILTKEFSDYRERVIEKYGKEEDYRLRLADKLEQIEEAVTDENGEEKTVVVSDAPKKNYEHDTLSRFFDEQCPAWKKDPSYNILFLTNAAAQLTDILRTKRVLTLNEVYEFFGWDRTQAGYQYGWVCQPGHELESFVSFGLPLGDRKWEDAMAQAGERYFLLDFNCSKIIWSETPFREA